MWGTLHLDRSILTSLGITPTCVGNTEKNFINFSDIEDHPHLCGEHIVVIEYIR